MATYLLEDGSIGYQCIRELLLHTRDRQCKVARELWHGPHGTYQAYRQYLKKCVRLYGFPSQKNTGLYIAHRRSQSQCSDGFTARKRPYSFSGMKHVFDASQLAITALSFGSLSNSLLAFANVSGDVWVVSLPPDGEPSVCQLEHVHKRAVQGLDWSFDNSLLLTTSLEGSACLWAPPATSPIRTFTLRGAATCCKFHPSNPNTLIIGTSKSTIEIFNASTGARIQKQTLPGGPEVSALSVTPTHLFAGDSSGSVYMFSTLLKHGKLQKLALLHRLHVAASGQSPVTALGLQRVCHTGDACPLLLASCMDSTLAVLKVYEGMTPRLEWHSKHAAPRAARRITPQWCPTVALQDSDYIAMGAEDTQVRIYDIGKQHAAPLPVAVLQGHCAPTTTVSWSYDELLLSSGDCNGAVIVWQRDDAALTPQGSRASSLIGTPRSSTGQVAPYRYSGGGDHTPRSSTSGLPPYRYSGGGDLTPPSLSRASSTSLAY